MFVETVFVCPMLSFNLAVIPQRCNAYPGMFYLEFFKILLKQRRLRRVDVQRIHPFCPVGCLHQLYLKRVELYCLPYEIL